MWDYRAELLQTHTDSSVEIERENFREEGRRARFKKFYLLFRSVENRVLRLLTVVTKKAVVYLLLIRTFKDKGIIDIHLFSIDKR